MPGKSTKFDRCVEGVKENSPDVDKPEAVCVAAGVRPTSWGKNMGEEKITLSKNGQWSLEKKYEGFDKLKGELADKGASDPGALAAAIGRKKYGKEAFQHAAASGKKMGKNEIMGYPEAPADAMAMNEDCYKDDAPHAPGSPEDSAHDVVEEGADLQEELKDLSSEEKKEMLAHLRTLKDKRKLRSEDNREKGKD